MTDEHTPTQHQERDGWLRRSTSSVVDLVSELFAPNSMISIVVAVVGGLVAACAYIFWTKQHRFEISAGFLSLVMVLPTVYAVFYGWTASSTKEFRRGLVSVRFVLCL